MSTNVPALTIGPTGPVLPDESAILAGTTADVQAAFGGNLNPALNTPQGQIASSNAAIIGDIFAAFAEFMAGIDPATSKGRLQDGIVRFYFLTRNPAQSTVVVLRCYGKTNAVIPINAKARDQAGNIYLCIEAGEIPAGGYIDLSFACAITGPIACPIGYVSTIYQTIPGWDSVENLAAGVVGNDAESPADLEYRRKQSVALNSTGQTGAILGAVLTVAGALDGYALENVLDEESGAVFVGSVSGNVLTVTEVISGLIEQGDMLLGATPGSVITGVLSGDGGVGTYSVSIFETVASTTLSSAPGGVPMAPHSILVSAYGGNSLDVATAIFRKKNPGCNYNGNLTVKVQDTNPGYTAPYPSYKVTFLVPTPTPVKFTVSMQNNANVPSDAYAQIGAAIVAAFNGLDGRGKQRIANPVFASRYYAGIAALGAWALIYKIQVGIAVANQDSILMRMDQIPTLAIGDILITFA